MTSSEPRRFGQIIKLRPGAYEEYKQYHAAVWHEVLQQIERSNIRDYVIYHHNGYLFAHFKYIGTDFEADMAKMKEDPKTLEWWKLMDTFQESFIPGATGSADGPGWWMPMEELFYFNP